MTLRVRVARYRHALQGGYRSPHLALENRSGLVLTLEAQGQFGQGEAAPLPSYSEDSLEDAERALESLDPPRLLPLMQLVEASEWGVELERELEALVPLRLASARYALESALLDLSARRRGLALHTLLRAHVDVPAQPIRAIERAALVALEPNFCEAEAALAAGFETLKVKLGALGKFAEERALLSQLRSRLGQQFCLRLDANQSFPPEAAQANLDALRELGVELIEEPTRPTDPWLEFPALGVALDESLRRDPPLSQETVRRHNLVALVLKPTALGGVLRCLRLASQARELGLGAIISHTFEGPVGFATLLELALAVGPARFAHGLGPHAGLLAWPEGAHIGRLDPRWSPRAQLGNGLSRVEVGLRDARC